MKITVHETGASAWERDGLSVYKRVNMRTAVGKRDQDISINYHRGSSGALHCLLTFCFDFELVPNSELEGRWCLVTLDCGSKKGAWGAFQYSVRNGRSLLTTDDPDVHTLFFASFVTRDWMASVRAEDEVIWQFPIPLDETFGPTMKNLHSELRGPDAKN